MRYFFALLILSITFACGKKGAGERAGDSLLASATGKTGEMMLFMDSTQWTGPLGDELRAIFRKEIPGLPREEAMFTLRYVDPRKLNSVLKGVRNLVFVVTLDNSSASSNIIKNYFTPESRERIRNSPNLFFYTAKNEFAKGQEVMYLFSRTEAELINHLKNNHERIINHFNQAEKERLTEGLFRAKEQIGFREKFINDYNFSIRIPIGYQLVMSNKEFVWLRQIDRDYDKDIFIARKPYTDEKEFEQANIIKFRDEMTSKYLFEDPERLDTFIMTETEVPFIPVVTKQLNFNGQYGIEMRGLWRTYNMSMGGPFVGYAIADEENGLFYYIEGFTYAPGKAQREIMRELDVILWTFNPNPAKAQ
ncbi:MAG TPA: DUF4837 family protein [Cyclobacteriaceae bacterium]|nr:DUF4837 family protein [Cyclobacteriaceae bacterium]